jgi:hypothetical protein
MGLQNRGEMRMKGFQIVDSSNDQLNPALLISLLPSFFLEDYKLHEDGILYLLKSDLRNYEHILETYLTSLHELTGVQFYFEVLSEQILFLKVYNTERLRLLKNLIYPLFISKMSDEK